MTIPSLDALITEFRRLGAQRILCKPLAENDNSKQQIYLGGGFSAINILPFSAITETTVGKVPTMKAQIRLSWLNDQLRVALAPGSQLILYPSYPEVRLSGFLRGCPTAPAVHLRPVAAASRKFNNGPDGRLLFLAILPSQEVIAYLALRGSAVAADWEAKRALAPFAAVGVFSEVPLPSAPDSRTLLLAELRRIHAAGWHFSRRAYADGSIKPYKARNGGGYTLEALFGIIPNGRAEPDYLGWELKACGSDRVTLMTPEPDAGYYAEKGVEAFVRQYGRVSDGDAIYFTGLHRVGRACPSTGQTLTLRGFDAASSKITDVNGGIFLIAKGKEYSAGWTFPRLIEHWGRKHALAAYVLYESRENPGKEYRYKSPVMLGEATSFERFLQALASGLVVYDPAPKVSGASTRTPTTKARSQFRIGRKNLAALYVSFTPEPIG